jgi:hypothetical protein
MTDERFLLIDFVVLQRAVGLALAVIIEPDDADGPSGVVRKTHVGFGIAVDRANVAGRRAGLHPARLRFGCRREH